MTPSQYYSKHLDWIEVPTHIDEREFGYQRADDRFVRHLAISNMSELWSMVMREYPIGLYCSNSRYRHPGAPMAEKQWISAELIFDIDGESREKLPTADVKELVDLLRWKFAIPADAISVYFSGNKGFHVHIKECEYDRLGSYGRHCIAQHIKSSGVSLDTQVTSDIHRIFRMPGSLNNKSGMPKVRVKDLDNMQHLFI